ncbi:MAG: ribosomal RNA small subunit methyltransferase A [Acidobacteria bacterium]|nr:ribosomal RNA small subunit methyltransferase A [Acidobacteriota bacterium]
MGRKWGQNFLVSTQYARRIVDEADLSGTVLEIGPGRGILTRELLTRGVAAVHAVEIDPRLCEDLSTSTSEPRLRLHRSDILDFDFDKLGEARSFVVGNIPYQITSPLIERLLLEWHRWSGMVLMVQREVADRICGRPRTRNYSALSVMVSTFAHAARAFDVHRRHFRPQPQVDSTVIVLRMRERPLVEAPADYAAFLKALFSQRRKKLSNSLKRLFEEALPADYGWLDRDLRVEALSVDSIARLYEQIRADPRAVLR